MHASWPGEISPAHAALAGHFPGNAVVPGALLLSQVAAALQHAAGKPVKITALDQVKFSAVLRPAEKFVIELQGDAPHSVRFSIRRGVTLIASGSLRYEEQS
ncbi:MAG: hypothetical protein ACREUV_10120 [Burkholderiales bacterium]